MSGATVNWPASASVRRARTGALLLLLLFVPVGCVAAQGPGKYVGREEGDPLAVFLSETDSEVSGALMLDYGLLMPFEGVRSGNGFSGELLGADPPTEVSGQRRGEELRFTISQGNEGQEYRLFLEKGAAIRFETPLLSMLALVPDSVLARLGSPGVSYADYRAVERAAGIDNPEGASGYRALTEMQRATWSNALRRVGAGPPELLMDAEEQIERLPDLLGFEWFDIDGALTYGIPPESVTIVTVDAEPDRIGDRLRERDFETREVAGVTVWHKGEDGALDLSQRDFGDPFDANLGKSQRISLLAGQLINSSYWQPMEALVGTAAGEIPSLAHSRDYRTLAEAIEDPATGELLQAVFLNPAEVGLMPADPAFLLRPDTPRAARLDDPLPFYGLAALADKQLGGERVGVVALLYRDLEIAESAAAVLEKRLVAFTEERFPQASFTGEAVEVHQSDSGLFAAVALIRSFAADMEVEVSQPGFSDWLRALTLREFYVLEVAGTP